MATKTKKTTAAAAPPADVFAQAAKRSAAPETSTSGATPKRGGTTLRIPDKAANEIHDAVRSYRASAVQIKSANAQLEAAEEALKPLAVQLFADVWAKLGDRPPGPVELESREGQRVTFVITDRTKNFVVSEEMDAALSDLVGAEQLNELVETSDCYSLDQEILEQPGVKQAISEAIKKAKLTADQRSRLLTHSRVRRFKAGCLNELAHCTPPAKLPELLDLLRSAAPRYLKA